LFFQIFEELTRLEDKKMGQKLGKAKFVAAVSVAYDISGNAHFEKQGSFSIIGAFFYKEWCGGMTGIPLIAVPVLQWSKKL